MLNLDNIIPEFSNIYFIAFFAILLAYLLSVRMYPVIIYLGEKKNLMDDPESRSSHIKKTPTLGGVGLFVTFSLALILLGIFVDLQHSDLIKLLSILAGTIILLFLGIKDDLIALSPKKKIIGQVMASLIVILMTDVRLEGLFSLFGIGELPYIVSVVVSVFIFIFIINAFNLVDGIDGLAGTIAIIASLSFGVFFFLNQDYLMVLVSSIIVGALIGFLRYNLSDTNKIFMGDSGSMFIGFLLAYQAISFLTLHEATEPSFMIPHPLILTLTVLLYPILDTCRVFTIRILQKRSPFAADHCHIHHRLLYLGLRHKQATLLVAVTNMIIIGSTFLMGGMYLHVQLYIVIVLFPIIVLSPFLVEFKEGKFKIVYPKIFIVE